jgi:hypothetical protein
MFQSQDNFCRIELHIVLGEDAVLTEMIVQITPVHQVQNETQLVRSLEGVRHADYERTVLLQQEEGGGGEEQVNENSIPRHEHENTYACTDER